MEIAEGEFAGEDLMVLSSVGNRLLSLAIAKSPISTRNESLIEDLQQASVLLSKLKQVLNEPAVHSAVKPSMDALVKSSLLKHEDEDVRLLVTKCVSEIIRIGAPDAPFNDETLKEIFKLIVAAFKGLNDELSPFFHIRMSILEIVAATKCCVVMLDLQCDDLILEMFRVFFQTVSEEPNRVHVATRAIMCMILEEIEEIPSQLVELLLQNVNNTAKETVKMCSILAGAVLGRCARKVGPVVQAFLTQISSEREVQESYNGVISAIYTYAPSLLFEIYASVPNLVAPVIPVLVHELLSDQLDIRLRAVRAASWFFSLGIGSLQDGLDCLHERYVQKFSDNEAAIRLAVIEGAKQCLLTDHFVEATEFLRELGNLVGDNDPGVRVSAIDAICQYSNSKSNLISVKEGKFSATATVMVWIEALKKVAECLEDTEILIRRKVIESLTSLYKSFCSRDVPEWNFLQKFLSWIPSKLIRSYRLQQEFRTCDIDLLLSEQLFPPGFPVNERVKCWISFYSASEQEVIDALQNVLHQKQRLQQEMHNYLLVKDKLMRKDEENEVEKRELCTCFKIMARSYFEPAKAASEIAEFFMQLNDMDLLRQFAELLDPNTTFDASMSLLEILTCQLGEGHTVRILAVKCAYLLFGKEHVKALLEEIANDVRLEDEKMLEARMGVLVIFLSNFPSLLGGVEANMMELFKENKQFIKESALQILAGIGKHLTAGHISLGILENLCSYGSCKQAKYALQVLANLSGPKIFSSLFMKLLDFCEMDVSSLVEMFAVSGTQEESIMNCIIQNVFRNENGCSNFEKTKYANVGRITRLKIFALKALVQVYCSAINLESIEELSQVLLKFLHRGEQSDDNKSDQADKDHLRLAAAHAVLRISKSYYTQLSPQLFYSTVLCAKDSSIYVRGKFLSKLSELFDEGLVSHAFGCAFVLGIDGKENDDLTEVRRQLADFVDGSHHQLWLQKAYASEHPGKPLITHYPEYGLFNLVHTLAQGAAFQSLSEGGPIVEVQNVFKQLSLFISALLGWYEGSKQVRIEMIGMIIDIFRTIKKAEDAIDTTKTEIACILSDIGIAIAKDISGTELRNMENIKHDIPLPLALYRAPEGPEINSEKIDGSHLPPHIFSLFRLTTNKNLAKKRKADGHSHKKAHHLKHKRVSVSSLPMGKKQVDLVSSEIQSLGNRSGYKMLDDSSALPIASVEKSELPSITIDSGNRKRGWSHDGNGVVSVVDVNNTDAFNKDDSHRHPKEKVPVENLDEGSTSYAECALDLANGKLDAGSARDQVQTPIRTPQLTEDHKSEAIKKAAPATSIKTRGKQFLSGLKDDKGSAFASLHRTPMRSTKKTMPSGSEKSILLEDKTVEASPKDLVGHRVRVWWPMDKQFYLGVVSSYNTATKKHQVVYDDGDVEDLRLEKERWELVENSTSSPSVDNAIRHLKKEDAKRQPNKEQPETETGHGMFHKLAKRKEKKDVNKSKKPSDVKNRTPVYEGEKRSSDEREDSLTLDTVSRARSAGRKSSTSVQPPGPQSNNSHSPPISKDLSDDLPLSAWKSMRKKSH